VRDVAERPQTLVCKAVVVSLFLLLCEPYTAKLVRGIFDRNLDAIVPVHDLAIG